MYKTLIDIIMFNLCLEALFRVKSCERENLTRKFKEICGLVVTTWVPFNIDVFPLKQILYLWQCYTIVFTMKGAAIVSFGLMESMEHLVVRIQHLKELLLETVDTENEKLRNEMLGKCVEYHIDIFEYWLEIVAGG